MAKKATAAKRSRAALPPVSRVKRITLADIAGELEAIAPLHLAQSWDNVGLISGDKSAIIKRVLLAIDLTPAVYQELVRGRFDLLVAYHPPIFKPLKTLRLDSEEPPVLAIQLCTHGIGIYCPHTALDAADGGTNDVLARTLGARVTGSFSQHAGKPSHLKLVVFVPEAGVERVAEAVYAAGAGHIGTKAKYTQCSFRTGGTGTFFGDAFTNPAVGRKGELERVPEIRFETILPAAQAEDVIAALRKAHPYEEPAFDLLKMETPPEAVGLGRFAALPAATTLGDLARCARQALDLKAIGVIGNLKRSVTALAVMAGSAGRLPLDDAFGRHPFDCLITGEIKHHDALAYHAAGIAVLCLGHAQSERPVLKFLQARLRRQYPELSIQISLKDAPLTYVL